MPSAPTEITLQALYLEQIARQVAAAGADPDRWLAGAGLRREPPAEAQVSLPLASFSRLVRDALELTGEPALGLLVGDSLRINTHGVVGFAAMNGGSLRQVIGMIERYLALRTSLVSIRPVERDGELQLRVDDPAPLGDVRRTVFEAIALALKHMLDFGAQSPAAVAYVAFDMPAPPYEDLARHLFRCEIRWGQGWSGIAVAAVRADEPLRAADLAALALAEAMCERELQQSTAGSVAAEVMRVILETPSGLPPLATVARRLHLTPRTLHRRLVAEGTSFRRLVDELRRDLAVEHLRSGRMTLQEIAFAVGYTDMANFRRAFRRWEGVPPSAARRAVGRTG